MAHHKQELYLLTQCLDWELLAESCMSMLIYARDFFLGLILDLLQKRLVNERNFLIRFVLKI
jgi:hypothetical protein